MHPIRTTMNALRDWRGRGLAAVVLATAAAGSALAQSAGDFDLPGPLLDVARIMEMQARDAKALSLQTVQVRPGAAADEQTFDVTLDGMVRTVTLRPHSVRARDCMAYEDRGDGVLIPVELPEPRTFRGEVNGAPGLVAAATIDPDGRVTALIHDPLGDSWAVEPRASEMPGVPNTVYAVYRAKDINFDGSTCGTTDIHRVMPAPGDPGFIDPQLIEQERDLLGPGHVEAMEQDALLGGSNSQAQIAFDADYEYYQANGFSTPATILDIETVMNAVGVVYQNQNGICYAATGYIIRTNSNDPYTTSDPNDLLDEFTAEWQNNVSITRDIAHLFTGRDVDGGTIGIAWVGVVCGNFRYGLSQSQYSENFTNRTQLTAHELGHNWNACHCNQSGCTGGGTDGDCGIMNSFVQGSLTFGSRALGTIESHRASRSCLGTCRSTTYVDIDNGGIETGTFTFPWDTWREGHDYAKIFGAVLIRNGSYNETGTYSKPLTLDMDGAGSATIGD